MLALKLHSQQNQVTQITKLCQHFCLVYVPFYLELYFPLESCDVQLYLQSSTGVWGPYPSALLKDTWLHEGGQSAVGNLLDLIVETHPAYPQVFLHSIQHYR